MIKQDIIKAREELGVRRSVQKGYDFARVYKAIREVLIAMVNGRPDLVKQDIRLPRYVLQKLHGLGIAALQLPSYVHFRLMTPKEVGKE